MIWLWIICGIVVLMSLSAIWRVFSLFFFAFTVAFGGMLLIHMRESPGEATVALAGLGGAVLLRRPLVRMITRLI